MGTFSIILLVLSSFIAPRISCIHLALWTNYFQEHFETSFWPIMGGIFLPYTTLAYLATAVCNEGQMPHIGWMLLWLLGLFFDVLSMMYHAGKAHDAAI